MDKSKEPGVTIAQIILTSAHFEHRGDYLSLPPSTPMPEISINVHAQAGLAADGKTGVIRLTVSSDQTKNPHYNLSVTMEGIISVEAGKENMTVQQYSMTSGVALLYPFAREVVANLTSRGRFGPIWLKPFNVSAAVAAKPPVPAARPAVAGSTTVKRQHP